MVWHMILVRIMLTEELWGRIINYLVGGPVMIGSVMLFIERIDMLREIRSSTHFRSRRDPMTLTTAIMRYRKTYPLWAMKAQLTMRNNTGIIVHDNHVFMFHHGHTTYVSVNNCRNHRSRN